MKKSLVLKFLPAILWMAIIFYFSSRSTAGIGSTAINRLLILKSFHLIEYAILAILLFIPIRAYKTVLITSYIYAISDEIHQGFIPGRTPKITDTIIDLVGICLGILFIHLIQTHLKKTKNTLH